MGDMGDVFNAMRADTQRRHRVWKEHNTDRLTRSGVPYQSVNNGETLLFRETGKPRVDFYPSTGRWRVTGQSKTFRGGATAFLKWYLRNVKDQTEVR